MVSKIKVGRPAASSFHINLMKTKVLQYKKRYNTTSFNAFMRLTTHKAFKELISDFYDTNKNKPVRQKTYHIKRMLNDPEVKKQFYKDHIIKDRTGIMGLIKTKPKDYIRRKK